MTIFCDVCGDVVTVTFPIKVEFPDGSKLKLNVCPDCWKRSFEGCRKLRVAQVLRVLLEE